MQVINTIDQNKRRFHMRTQLFLSRVIVIAVVFGAIGFVLPQGVFAHCDTLDGPVVMTAKKALEQADVTPVLKWVKKEYEQEIRTAFQKTLAVRAKGPEAKELADMYFFETLVRLHRAGEGAPYTGLKAAGTVDPAVVAADKALENGSVDGLVKNITNTVSRGIRERFARTIEKKQHADESIDAGREFVEAYVEFVHYVERLHLDAAGKSLHHAD
jgi:hypothetical protein